jgi:hypothetical protein
MTLLTGDPFFPGGMSEFHAEINDFLVFEEGPSTDIVLQWATYRDVADQCSLSRIWGGIHPPADDIPGRLMGMEIGVDAFADAETFFYAHYPSPVAGNDVYTMLRNQPLVVTVDVGVLANDSDPENAPVTAAVKSLPTHGSLSLAADGSFSYTPATDYVYITPPQN